MSPPGHPRRPRTRPVAALLGAAVLSLCAVLVHASLSSRRCDHEEIAALVRALGEPDLALSSTSRWLRHVHAAEPGAPFADHPSAIDPDPAGGWIGAPFDARGKRRHP